MITGFLFRVLNLNEICTERCGATLLQCINDCETNDSPCLSKCIRDENECINGELQIKIIFIIDVNPKLETLFKHVLVG